MSVTLLGGKVSRCRDQFTCGADPRQAALYCLKRKAEEVTPEEKAMKVRIAGRAFLCPLLLDSGGSPSGGRHGLLHVIMLHVTMPSCEARSEGASSSLSSGRGRATAGTPA